jgi:putative SOS response-associated peptidase YedK
MCGRYAASRRPEDLIEEFEIEAVAEQAPGED